MKKCTSENEILASYSVMKQLRGHLSEQEYLEKVQDCQKKAGYELYVYQTESNEIAACCGVMPMPTLYYDQCLWICDLVVDEKQRSKGIGKKVLDEMTKLARNEGYNEIALSSGLQRIDAHHFYEENGELEKVSYVFKKEI